MFEEKIKRGIQFLDSRFENWVDKIDLNTLNMGHYDNCIISQICKEQFNDSLVTLNITPQLSKFYGFDIEFNDNFGDYKTLTKEWKDTIINLRSNTIQNNINCNKEVKKEEHYIEVLKAYLDGKTIQFQTADKWFTTKSPDWDFTKTEYRIKPEPKEIWMIKGGQHIFNSKKEIIDHCCFSNISITEIIHFKQVI
jgi:hypothetical protein